jgi:hypothetical protein
MIFFILYFKICYTDFGGGKMKYNFDEIIDRRNHYSKKWTDLDECNGEILPSIYWRTMGYMVNYIICEMIANL